MAGQASILDDAEVRARWSGFEWTDENRTSAAEIVARYPEGRQMSASIPLLDLAQRQVGTETGTQGWLPIRPTAFSHLQAMDFMMQGHMLADVTAVLSAIDVVFGEVDR